MEKEFIVKSIEDTLSQSFLEYAGYNLQRRSIPDVRDGLKWGARQLLHAQMLGKFTYNKPFKKAIKSVSQAMGFSYVHGDSSAYGTFIRMAKPFVMNIPLQEANGNYGTLIDPDDHSASRYVEMRGSEASAYLLKDLDKDTITEWEDTYDLEGKFPKVLPSKGFWNLVNGCISIGSGMSCSIPPFNLKEMNNELIKLLWDKDYEVEILPDFPTGATILNKNEVLESLKHGTGKSCKIRANIEFDQLERCFIVKEMPYSTYTNTICNELVTIIQEDEKCGIKEFVDYTGQKPDLRIYLTKNANPNKVLKMLYKNTSLQTFYSINMVLLDNGEKPRIFGLKEAMQAHLNHEISVYRRGFLFDLNKINNRIHIIEGLLKAISILDEVIALIKSAADARNASFGLQNTFSFSEEQAKAILEIKLARLAKLEVNKLEKEKSDLEKERDKIENILQNEELLKKEIEKGLQETAKKFGDARRTKILNIENEDDEIKDIKRIVLNYTNYDNIYLIESSTLYTQKRGGVGAKFKLDNGEYISYSEVGDSNDILLLFTNKGNFFHIKIDQLPINEKINISSFITPPKYERICSIAILSKSNKNDSIIFVTKNGMLKKSKINEYNLSKNISSKAIELECDDEIISALLLNNEPIGIVTNLGNFILIKTEDLNHTGRVTKGRIGIKLNENDFVSSARVIPDGTKTILSITKGGQAKQSDFNEFNYSNIGTKGKKIQKLLNEDQIVSFLPISNMLQDILIISNASQIKIKCSDIPIFSRGAQGIKVINLKEKYKVIEIQSI